MLEKKEYMSPFLDVISFEPVDVIATSDGNGDPFETEEDNFE